MAGMSLGSAISTSDGWEHPYGRCWCRVDSSSTPSSKCAGGSTAAAASTGSKATTMDGMATGTMGVKGMATGTMEVKGMAMDGMDGIATGAIATGAAGVDNSVPGMAFCA